MIYTMDCCCNFRDLGGLAGADGRVVVADKLFRGEVLANMSESDIKLFKSLDIKDVVDFRSPQEAEQQVDTKVEGVTYHAIPSFDLPTGIKTFDFASLIKDANEDEIANQLQSFIKKGYRDLPFNNKSYQEVFDLMLDSDDGIFFHCSAGKDRTGVMAALILTLLGVDRKLIDEDFLLSNTCRRKKNEEFYKTLKGSEKLMESTRYLTMVDVENLQLSFNEIAKKYSSMDEYFEKEYGLTKDKITFLRNKYLTK